MFARAVHFVPQPAHRETVARRLRGCRVWVSRIPGVIRTDIAWDAHGRGVLFGLYETRAAAVAMALHMDEIWQELTLYMEEGPRAETFGEVDALV